MGRAIDHENSIDELKIKLKRLEDTIRGMVSTIDAIKGKDKKNVKKESNNERSTASSKSGDSKSSVSESKSSKSRSSK
mgnify:CR=1 FL=1